MKRDIPDIHDFAARKNTSLTRIMDFTTTVNPLGPSAKARNAVRKNVKVMDRHPDAEARFLIRAIARAEGVPEKNVLVGETFAALATSILQAHDASRVMCAAPYPAYYRGLQDGPLELHFCPLDKTDRFRLDIAAWLDEMRRCDAAILPCPSFVSAAHPPRDAIDTIVREAAGSGTLLIIDETLGRYSQIPSLSAAITGSDRCLVLGSLSEYYALAGLPVSYAIGSDAALRGIRQRSFISPPGTLAAAAAVESLRDRTYPRRTRSFIESEGSFVEEGLRRIPGITFFTTSGGSFVITFVDHPVKPLETFSRYRIIVDDTGDAQTLFFPVKDHKWNARYVKTLKNIMGVQR